MSLFELKILDWIQESLRTPFGDKVMTFVSFLGNGAAIWIIIALLLLILPKQRYHGKRAAATLALEVLLCNVLLKPAVARIRPYDLNPQILLIVARPSDFSFPSGHTGAAFAVATALWLSKSPLRIPAMVLAALMGFSRLYLYVHYPTDVLAAALLGSLCAVIIHRLAARLRAKKAGN